MIRRALIFLTLFLIHSHPLFAGNTGKLVGRVTDESTGEPLAGVNIVLRGTVMGAATDIDGEYFVLNIPPGKYTVECTYIGYQTMSVENLEIRSDHTSVVDFKMPLQTMELDEKIIVVADRPLIHKDLTSSKVVTTEEEIRALPVESYAGIMLTQAGVTQGAGGELHIRGGRSTEIAYLVDGVSVANPFNTNSMATSVATNAIQEMSVVTGAFNAEYGNAMSGVVNFTTKDGSRDIKTFLSFYTGDYVSTHDNIFINIDDINPFASTISEGTLSGPLSFLGLDPGNNFFLSLRHSNSEGYFYGIREHVTTDSANFELKPVYRTYKDDEDKNITVITYLDQWYIERNGDHAFVPMNPSTGLNLMGKLKFQLGPTLALRVQSLMDYGKWKSYVHAYKYNPEGIYRYRENSYNHSLQLTHTLSPSTFYEFKAAFNTRKYTQYAYEDINDPRYAPTDKIQGDPGGSTFLFGGTQMGHTYEDSKSYIGKFDITSQINKNNLLKSGAEFRIHALNEESFTIGYNRVEYRVPTRVNPSLYNRYPRQFSSYVQDKLEYEDMIINAGLRYDYFYADADYALEELQPDGTRQRAEPKHMLAPRLGISFPITATGIIHLSYGHFYQMPTLRNLYLNPFFLLPATGTPTFGNANLNPEKTIMYEIGLQQQFTDMIALNVTGFYKDIRDLLAWQTITFLRLDGDRQDYRIRRNQDYANVKGITVTLEKRMRPDSPVSAKLDYTFMVSEGNDDDASAFYYNSLSGQENIKEIIPLDWDQSHNLYASVAVVPFTGMTVSMIGKLSSGYPYTPDVFNSNYDAQPNTSRKPTIKTVDLKAAYRFPLYGTHMQVFFKIYNLFDTLNQRYVFDDTGSAKYTFANRIVNEPDSFRKHYGEPGVHTYDEYNVRPDYYRAPREINLGLSIEF